MFIRHVEKKVFGPASQPEGNDPDPSQEALHIQLSPPGEDDMASSHQKRLDMAFLLIPNIGSRQAPVGDLFPNVCDPSRQDCFHQSDKPDPFPPLPLLYPDNERSRGEIRGTMPSSLATGQRKITKEAAEKSAEQLEGVSERISPTASIIFVEASAS